MIGRSLIRLSHTLSHKNIPIRQFKKFNPTSTLLINRRGFRSQSTDVGNTHQYPDTESTDTGSNFNKNAQNAKENLKNDYKNVRENVKDNYRNVKDNLKDNYRDVESNVKSNVQDTFENTKQNFNKNYRDTESTMKDSFEDTKQNFNKNYRDAESNVRDSFENTKENLKDKTKNTFENMKENVNESYQNAKEKVKDTYNQFKGDYNRKFDNTTQSVKQGVQNAKQTAEDKYNETKQDWKDKFNEQKEDVKDKYDKTKSKMKDKAEEGKAKMENMKEDTKSTMENMKEKTKESFENIKNELKGTFAMTDMLTQAKTNFENLLKLEDVAAKDALKDAKAIIFLSIVKSGLGISGVMGSGVMIARTNNNEWSGPIAIGLTGVSIGLNAGYEKADNIIIIRDEKTLKDLSKHRELQLSGDITYVMGKTGRTSSYPLTTKEHETIPMVAYSTTKGAYVSLSLKGEMLKIKNDFNEEFYSGKVSVEDILNSKVNIPHSNEYRNLIKVMNNYFSSSDKNKRSTSKQSQWQ